LLLTLDAGMQQIQTQGEDSAPSRSSTSVNNAEKKNEPFEKKSLKEIPESGALTAIIFVWGKYARFI